MRSGTGLSADRPFPGLRSFSYDDRDYFFGREEQVYALYSLLELSQFVAVVGSSGSGKSSLVRAGLLPLLDTEREEVLAREDAASHRAWRWIELHPGDAPLGRLAEKLAELAVPEVKGPIERAARRERLEYALRRGSFGMSEALTGIDALANHSLLIVVDQFEELFRYGRTGPARAQLQAERDQFVQLLLEATSHRDVDVHVLITMRSDFIGDCAFFSGLPEAVSGCQFLVPSLSRLQRDEVVRHPLDAEHANSTIEPALVERLLNDAGSDLDQLPVLQHCLSRLWEIAGPSMPTPPNRQLRQDHYTAIGGIGEALSRHADEILAGLDAHKVAVEQVFRALSEIDNEGRATRRALRYGDLRAETGIADDELRIVVDRFRADDCSFLVPSVSLTPVLAEEDIVDIGHEALLRRWKKIGAAGQETLDGETSAGWLAAEASDGRIYRAMVTLAGPNPAAATLPLDQVEDRWDWWCALPRTAAWANRYGGHFERVERLFNNSLSALYGVTANIEKTRQEEQRRRAESERLAQEEAQRRLDEARRSRDEARRSRRFAWTISTISLITVVIAVVSIVIIRTKSNEAEFQRRNADFARHEAQEKALDLEREKQSLFKALQDAELSRSEANRSRVRAEQNAREAELEKKRAEQNAREAELEMVRADLALALAIQTVPVPPRNQGVCVSPDGTAAAIFQPNVVTFTKVIDGSKREIRPSGGFRLVRDRIVSKDDSSAITVYDCAGNALAAWKPAGTLLPQLKSLVVNGWLGVLEQGGDLALSRDSRRLLIVQATLHAAIVLDLGDGSVHSLGTNVVRGTLSGDGRHIATISTNDAVGSWDAVTGNRLCEVVHGTPTAIEFSTNGRHLAIGEADGTLRIIDVANCTEIRSRPGRGIHPQDLPAAGGQADPRRAISFISYWADDTVVTAAVTGDLRVEDAYGKVLEEAQLSPDSNWHADEQSGRVLAISAAAPAVWRRGQEGMISLESSDMGRPFAVQRRDQERTISCEAPEVGLSLYASLQPKGDLQSMGELVAILSDELRLWSSSNGHLVLAIPVKRGNCVSAGFSADGHTFFVDMRTEGSLLVLRLPPSLQQIELGERHLPGLFR